MDLVDKIIELTDLFDDNVVTTADKIPQPEPKQEVLDREAIDAFMKRNPMAGGGRIGYRKAGDVDPPKVNELKIAEKKYSEKYNKKGIDLWKSLKQFERSNIRQKQTTGGTGGVPGGKLKKNQIGKDEFIKLVNANKDKTYNQFVEILKDYKTKDNKPFTKNIIADRLRAYNLSGSFKKEPPKGKDLTKKAETEKKRQEFLKETDTTKAKGKGKFQYHHIRQIAGGVPLTSDDVMVINQRINSKIGGETNKTLNRISAAIRKNNRLALEAMNAKEENLALEYMKRSDDLNAQAEKIVNSAIDKLPEKYKGYVGFNQFTLPRDEYGFPIGNEPMIIKKVGGMPVSKDAIDLTNLNLKDEAKFRKIVKQQAERGKVGKVDVKKMKSDGPTLGMNLGFLKGFGEAIKAVPTPTGTALITGALGVDPTSAIDRASIGAEAAFAPQLVKQVSKITSNPIYQRFLNLGLSPTAAMRVARVASPIGLASLIGEATIGGAKESMKESERIDAIQDQDTQMQEYDNLIKNITGYAGGGIAKLAGVNSGPPPEAGPNSQGLSSLMKRGTNI